MKGQFSRRVRWLGWRAYDEDEDDKKDNMIEANERKTEKTTN